MSIDIAVENCAICRNHIMDLCIECQAMTSTSQQPKSKGAEDCTIAWGKCNVSLPFHKMYFIVLFYLSIFCF